MNKENEPVITDTRHSRYSRIKPVSIKSVQMEEGFWKSRIEDNQIITIPAQYQLLESTGRLDNFRRISGKIDKPYRGYVFNDSDVYKWLEAASWTLIYDPSEELSQFVDSVISLIASAQNSDGYLNTYFSFGRAAERWTNLQDKHELYCAGHFIQAAIAHKRATDDDKALNIAIKLADHIYTVFGPNKTNGTCGHPEIEMALIELYRITRDERYLELAKLFIDRRGYGILGNREYLLDHLPFRKLHHLAGHAVRALYLCAGATDLYLETGEHELLDTLNTLWSNMISQQIYITGGLGSRHDGESFGEPYELPNERAYAETCAAIASVMWNWRMFQVEGKSQFCDTLEWTLYNAVLSGISLDGAGYFYVNPLKAHKNTPRQPWFDCACCPPNVSRTLAMLPGYIYSCTKEGIWINLFASSKVTLELPGARQMILQQTTSYPWDGKVVLTFSSTNSYQAELIKFLGDNQFSLFIRIPSWLATNSTQIKINHTILDRNVTSGGYVEIKRQWQEGDVVEIIFPMQANYIEAHPSIEENSGKIAITRGPLVYCFEEVDNPGIDFDNLEIDVSKKIDEQFLPELLGGITQLELEGKAHRFDSEWDHHLYRPYTAKLSHIDTMRQRIKAIPYFAWANREQGEMQIWSNYKGTN